jgi:hypothetical protein
MIHLRRFIITSYVWGRQFQPLKSSEIRASLRVHPRGETVMSSRTSHFQALFALSTMAFALICGRLFALDDPAKDKEQESRREEQLKKMMRSASQYILTSADDPKRRFKFHDTAIMRFTNPVGHTKDGAIYVWSDRGLPQAILKLLTVEVGSSFYSHEWLSLSESGLSAEREGKVIWNPSERGLTFQELPDAPKPADSPAERLRQMKSLSAKFSATYTARHLDSKPFELRLLSQPLMRVEPGKETECRDCSVFAFVQDGDPVGLLLFEDRQTKDGHQWHYACASMVTGPLTVRYGDKEVFSLEKDYKLRDPKRPYLQLFRQPVPKE